MIPSRVRLLFAAPLAVTLIASLALPVPAAAMDSGEVLITLPEGADPAAVAADLARDGVRVSEIYTETIAAVVVETSAPSDLDVPPGARAETVMPVYPARTPWHLDRLDQRNLPLDGIYAPNSASNEAQGVRVYVVDSGIRPDHVELVGRVLAGFNVADDQPPSVTADGCGHGTAVASTAAGATLGVARDAVVVPVRVFDRHCHAATTATVIAGLDWIAATHPPGLPGVVNLSLATVGEPSPALDAAATALADRGLVVVAAAGNAGGDACLSSPARAEGVIAVGATDIGDRRAAFSNHGKCVDLWAPGVDIRAADHTGVRRESLVDGTSFAAPATSGAAALRLAMHPASDPARVHRDLTVTATTGAVRDRGPESPDRLLHVPPRRFSDVPDGYVHTRAIAAAAANGIIDGYPDGTFRPGQPVTRAQAASMLARAFGAVHANNAPFTDVPIDHVHADGIAAAAASGIIDGYPDGTFRPGQPVTRAQAASMLARAFGAVHANNAPFTDVPIDHVHADGIAAAAASGIIDGYQDGSFRPNAALTRGQAATVVARGMEWSRA